MFQWKQFQVAMGNETIGADCTCCVVLCSSPLGRTLVEQGCLVLPFAPTLLVNLMLEFNSEIKFIVL